MLSPCFRSLRACLVAVLALGCGGSDKPAESADTRGSSPQSAREQRESQPTTDDDSDAPTPPRATCDDGTCTPCGDALCPKGWYCDETAHGGPACGWLPECAQKSGCACVKKALSCACEEKSGSAHVTCS
jgi:hypothetical protein